MFTDLTGFTALAESRPGDVLADLVQAMFDRTAGEIEAHGGTVHQLAGDGVVAFWGAPDPDPDHALHACRAALGIARVMTEIDREFRARADIPLRMRIGLHSGRVVAGNLGSDRRWTYGLVGDTMNTTQRLEQLGKELCGADDTVAILTSAATAEKAAPAMHFADLGVHAVKGRSGKVHAFRLLGSAALPAKTAGVAAGE